jgi:carbamate kinase
MSLLRVDAAADRAPAVPPMPLDVCVSETQGSMGFLLETAITNRLKRDAVEKPVVTMLTRVIVDAGDPAFKEPSKPVGPFFPEARARRWMEEHGHLMAEDSGRGWRRLVSSPKPLAIVEIDVIRHLLSEGHIVIAGGGGGIPVCDSGDGMLHGVEAVIDKDYVASLMARAVGADLFIILTEVSHVCLDFGRRSQKKLDRMTLIEAIDHYRAGQFPKGSMGPKLEAAIDYLMNGGTEALITSAGRLGQALGRKSGTYIVRSETGGFIDLEPGK